MTKPSLPLRRDVANRVEWKAYTNGDFFAIRGAIDAIDRLTGVMECTAIIIVNI
jgi:hypothetical protein